jgi:hypothetical protein
MCFSIHDLSKDHIMKTTNFSSVVRFVLFSLQEQQLCILVYKNFFLSIIS